MVRLRYNTKKDARTLVQPGLNTSPSFVLTSAVYRLVFYERSEVSRLWGGFEP